MDNAAIADNFSLLSKLLDIHGENSFKSKTYSIAAFNIEKLPLSLKDTPREKIFTIKGIGESVGKKVIEMLDTGMMATLTDLIASTPPGVIEMLNIKGIGPKKIHTIWKEMEVESIGELLYACNENRLTLYKGFGQKTQATVQENIEFYLANQGNFLYAQLEEVVPQIDQYLKKLFPAEKVHLTGAYRRQMPTIEELEYVILEPLPIIKPKFETAQPPEILDESQHTILYKLKNGLKLKIYAGGNEMVEELFKTTGSEIFLAAFNESYPEAKFPSYNNDGDETLFTSLNLPYIIPALRETGEIIELAKKNKLPKLITEQDIRGIIHSHSNWSDGADTVEAMATACIADGFEYLVISDHSQSAGYANGLKADRIYAQHQLINQHNTQFAKKPSGDSSFKLFKSIESDILNDGNLDYPENILQTFDLVIASVHSNLKMTEEKAMMRLMNAIENPYTNILGHMTGRLLLSRNGYPVDHKKIIDACAANHVVIEINAHPRRLDMDWQWINYALSKNVLLSINPDAHAPSGYHDVKYGVLAAQKGGLTKEHNLSSYTLPEFENWLLKNKQLKGTI